MDVLGIFTMDSSNILSILALLPNIILLIIYLASKNKTKIGRIVIPILYASVASNSLYGIAVSILSGKYYGMTIVSSMLIPLFIHLSIIVTYIIGMITSITGKTNKAVIILVLISGIMYDIYAMFSLYNLINVLYGYISDFYLLTQSFTMAINIFVHIALFVIGLKSMPGVDKAPTAPLYSAPVNAYAQNYNQTNQNIYTPYAQPTVNYTSPQAQPTANYAAPQAQSAVNYTAPQAQSAPEQNTPKKNTPAEMLRLLNIKRELGMITQEEYNQISSEIIKNL